MKAKGVNFQYSFTRKATISGNSLVLDYNVANEGDAPLYHAYVFHPLFKGVTGCFLEAPPEAEAKIMYSTRGFLGKNNTVAKLADLKDKDGKAFLGSMFTEGIGRYYKFVLQLRDHRGKAVLRYPDRSAVTISWTEDTMPFLAVWVSEDGVKGLHHIAPEPSVSSFDTLEQAYKTKQARMIPPGKSESWTISIAISDN